MLGRIILGGLYGLIGGLAWAFALGLHLKPGMLYGSIIGAIISLVIFFITLSVISRGNVQQNEAFFAANFQSLMLLVVAIASALITWLIRIIFF